jgi:hypothetical protein
LLDLLAAAARTHDLFLVMTGKGQYLREFFLAVVAEELVLGHGGTSMMQKGNEKIVDPFDRQFNTGTGRGFCDFVGGKNWPRWEQETPVSSGLVMKLLPTRIVVIPCLGPTALAIYE